MTAFSRWLCLLASALAVLAIVSGAHFQRSAAAAKSELERVNAALESANAVTGNIKMTIKIFSAITAERANEKERDRQQGETRRAALRDDLQGDRCAAEPVPAAAERRLFERAESIRSGAVPAAARRASSANASTVPTPER